MNTPKTSNDVMRELNELSRKLGRYPTRRSWEIEPQPGSILDVPLTPEEEARIHRLDALIARLERAHTAEAPEEQQDLCSQAQHLTASSPGADAHSTPTATTPAP